MHGNVEGVNKIRLIIVDDHPVVREGVRRVLERAGDIEVVGEASTGVEALHKAELLQPDIALMDIQMPDMDGIEVTRRLREAGVPTRVVVLSIYGEEYLAPAIEAGARGYLQKDISAEELKETIRAVHRGESVVSSSLSSKLFSQFATMARVQGPAALMLTSRQKEILHLLSTGATNKELAAQVFVSQSTLKREMRRILEKLEVKRRSEAISEAYRRGLL